MKFRRRTIRPEGSVLLLWKQ